MTLLNLPILASSSGSDLNEKVGQFYLTINSKQIRQVQETPVQEIPEQSLYAQEMPGRVRRRKRRSPVLRVILIAVLVIAVFVLGHRALGCIQHRKQFEKSEVLDVAAYKDLDVGETTERIVKDYHKIVEDYYDSEGYLKDEAQLAESSRKVYDWGTSLKDAGVIKECTLCDIGQTVAFWLDDKHCELYIPAIRDVYAGAGNQEDQADLWQAYSYDSITFFDGDEGFIFFTSAVFPAASTKSAGKIASLKEYEEHKLSIYWGLTEKECNSELASLKEALQHMTGNQVFFWTSHGNIYADAQGRLLVALIGNAYSNCPDFQEDYDRGLLATSEGRFAVNTLFFDEYLAQSDGGLFYCGSCYSACDGGNLANVFLNHGFDAYVGSDGSISQAYSNLLMETTTSYLKKKDDSDQYYTLQEAMDKAKAIVGYTDFRGVTSVAYEDNDNVPYRVVGMGARGANTTTTYDSMDDSDVCIVNLRPYEWLIPPFTRHVKVYVTENYSPEDLKILWMDMKNSIESDNPDRKYDVVVVKWPKKIEDAYKAGKIKTEEEIGNAEVHNLKEWWQTLKEYIGYIFSMNSVWKLSNLK